LLPHHARRIGLVDVRARSPLTLSVVLCKLGDERTKAPITPCAIPIIDFEQIGCRTAHLAISISSELGQKMPFLIADLEAQPAPCHTQFYGQN
jgi:hypothetical protein